MAYVDGFLPDKGGSGALRFHRLALPAADFSVQDLVHFRASDDTAWRILSQTVAAVPPVDAVLTHAQLSGIRSGYDLLNPFDRDPVITTTTTGYIYFNVTTDRFRKLDTGGLRETADTTAVGISATTVINGKTYFGHFSNNSGALSANADAIDAFFYHTGSNAIRYWYDAGSVFRTIGGTNSESFQDFFGTSRRWLGPNHGEDGSSGVVSTSGLAAYFATNPGESGITYYYFNVDTSQLISVTYEPVNIWEDTTIDWILDDANAVFLGRNGLAGTEDINLSDEVRDYFDEGNYDSTKTDVYHNEDNATPPTGNVARFTSTQSSSFVGEYNSAGRPTADSRDVHDWGFNTSTNQLEYVQAPSGIKTWIIVLQNSQLGDFFPEVSYSWAGEGSSGPYDVDFEYSTTELFRAIAEGEIEYDSTSPIVYFDTTHNQIRYITSYTAPNYGRIHSVSDFTPSVAGVDAYENPTWDEVLSGSGGAVAQTEAEIRTLLGFTLAEQQDTLQDLTLSGNTLTATQEDGSTLPITLPTGVSDLTFDSDTKIVTVTFSSGTTSEIDLTSLVDEFEDEQAVRYLGPDDISGTNFITATIDGVTAYEEGYGIAFVTEVANSSAMFVRINTLDYESLRDVNGVALSAGVVPAGRLLIAFYHSGSGTWRSNFYVGQDISDKADTDLANVDSDLTEDETDAIKVKLNITDEETGLDSVTSDATLTGDGTSGDPLSVDESVIKEILLFAQNTAYAVGKYVEDAQMVYRVITTVPDNNTSKPVELPGSFRPLFSRGIESEDFEALSDDGFRIQFPSNPFAVNQHTWEATFGNDAAWKYDPLTGIFTFYGGASTLTFPVRVGAFGTGKLGRGHDSRSGAIPFNNYRLEYRRRNNSNSNAWGAWTTIYIDTGNRTVANSATSGVQPASSTEIEITLNQDIANNGRDDLQFQWDYDTPTESDRDYITIFAEGFDLQGTVDGSLDELIRLLIDTTTGRLVAKYGSDDPIEILDINRDVNELINSVNHISTRVFIRSSSRPDTATGGTWNGREYVAPTGTNLDYSALSGTDQLYTADVQLYGDGSTIRYSDWYPISGGDDAVVATPSFRKFVAPDNVGGTANAITLTNDPVVTSLTTGDVLEFVAEIQNTNAVVTIEVDSISPVTCKRVDGTDLAVGDIKDGQDIRAFYDGTDFLLNIGGGSANVQSDWLEDDATSDTYIENKPGDVTPISRAESIVLQGSGSITSPAYSAALLSGTTNPVAVEFGTGSAEILSVNAGESTVTILKAGVYHLEWIALVDVTNERPVPRIEIYDSADTIGTDMPLAKISGPYIRGNQNNASITADGIVIIPNDNTTIVFANSSAIDFANDSPVFSVDTGQKVIFSRGAAGGMTEEQVEEFVSQHIQHVIQRRLRVGGGVLERGDARFDATTIEINVHDDTEDDWFGDLPVGAEIRIHGLTSGARSQYTLVSVTQTDDDATLTVTRDSHRGIFSNEETVVLIFDQEHSPQADWTEDDENRPAYVRHKPDLTTKLGTDLSNPGTVSSENAKTFRERIQTPVVTTGASFPTDPSINDIHTFDVAATGLTDALASDLSTAVTTASIGDTFKFTVVGTDNRWVLEYSFVAGLSENQVEDFITQHIRHTIRRRNILGAGTLQVGDVRFDATTIQLNVHTDLDDGWLGDLPVGAEIRMHGLTSGARSSYTLVEVVESGDDATLTVTRDSHSGIFTNNETVVITFDQEHDPQSSWSEEDENRPAYIRNKPSRKFFYGEGQSDRDDVQQTLGDADGPWPFAFTGDDDETDFGASFSVAFTDIDDETDADIDKSLSTSDNHVFAPDAGTYDLYFEAVGNQDEDENAIVALYQIESSTDDNLRRERPGRSANIGSETEITTYDLTYKSLRVEDGDKFYIAAAGLETNEINMSGFLLLEKLS